MIKFAQNNSSNLNFSTVKELMSNPSNADYLISGPEITELQNIRSSNKDIREIYNSFINIFKIFSLMGRSEFESQFEFKPQDEHALIYKDVPDPFKKKIQSVFLDVKSVSEIVNDLNLNSWEFLSKLCNSDQGTTCYDYLANHISLGFNASVTDHNSQRFEGNVILYLGYANTILLDSPTSMHTLSIPQSYELVNNYYNELNNSAIKIKKHLDLLMNELKSKATLYEKRKVEFWDKGNINQIIGKYNLMPNHYNHGNILEFMFRCMGLIDDLMQPLSMNMNNTLKNFSTDKNITEFVEQWVDIPNTINEIIRGKFQHVYSLLFDNYYEDNKEIFINAYKEYLDKDFKQDLERLSAQTGIMFNVNNFTELCSNFEPNNDKDLRQYLTVTQIRAITQVASSMTSIYQKIPAENYVNIFLNAILFNIRKNPNLERMFANELKSFYEFTQNVSYKGCINKEDCDKFNIQYDPNHYLFNPQELSRLYVQNKNYISEKLDSSMKKVKTRSVELSETDRLRMKELGITESLPPDMSYTIQQSKFPGGSWMKPEHKESVEFIIDFSPAQSLLENEFPESLFKDMHAHKGVAKGSNGLPAFGWVGGFWNPAEEAMYIHEVQSDVYQLATYMTDPKTHTQEKEKRVEEIDQQIAALQQQIQNKQNPQKKKHPATFLQQKINNSTKKIEELKKKIESLTPEQQEDKNNTQNLINQEELFINNLNQQIENIKSKEKSTDESTESNAPNPELHNLKQKIMNLTKEKEDLTDQKIDNRYFRRGQFKQYSQYKSKLENVFREWIKIFFNGAIREAKHLNAKKMYVITPESLLKIWSTFARPATRILFEKVYRENAAFYTTGLCTTCGKRLKPKWAGTSEVGEIPYDGNSDNPKYTTIEYWGCKDHPEERGKDPSVKQLQHASFFEINLNSDSIRIASVHYGKK